MRARSTMAFWPASLPSRVNASQRCCQACIACSAAASAAAAVASRACAAARPGLERGERGGERGELGLVAREQRRGLGMVRLGLLEVGALAGAQLAGVLDRLLAARGLGADLVAHRLHGGERLGLARVVRAALLDRGLGGAQAGDRGLERDVALARALRARDGLAVEVLELEREQLGPELALLLLQRLVAARGHGLALQVADLLVELLAQVVQAIEVLAGVRDAALGLAAPLLVLGDAGRLLEEGAHVVGLGLDEARDHALLDDRVAAAAEAGAEEELRDVLAPAARAVDEVGRLAVAPDLALEGHLGVGGVGTGDRAVGVVEDELDRGGADGLAAAGAVEDHVGHVVAAQVLGGDLAHDPAHRVDDVGLAAAVRADDAREVAWQVHGRRIDERLETGELELR